MKKSLVVSGALTALLAALLAVVPTSSAQAYPDPVCNLSVSASTIVGGEPLDVTVTSDIEADLSATFTVDAERASAAGAPGTNAATQASYSIGTASTASLATQSHSETQRKDDATRLDARFMTPKVATPTNAVVDCMCDGVARSTNVTLLPASASAGDGLDDADADGGDLAGLLPNAGGMSLWLLLLGLLLVVAGVTAAVRHRRA